MEDASHWKCDVNTSFLTPLQLQIQLSFTFQCSSGNLFSKYVKTIAMYLIYTNNHGPNHTDAVAIVSAAARELFMYATWHVPKAADQKGFGEGVGEGCG